MRPGHGGTISRLCACRRDHSDVRPPHRARAPHRGGAAAAFVARRATAWHACAVPVRPRGPSYRFLAWRICMAHPVRSIVDAREMPRQIEESFRIPEVRADDALDGRGDT